MIVDDASQPKSTSTGDATRWMLVVNYVFGEYVR